MSRLDGYLMVADTPLWGDGAIDAVDRALADDTLMTLNGSFGAIVERPGSITVVTDRLGSRPVYYARSGKGWLADFDYWKLARQLSVRTIDPAAAHQLIAFSYAVGERTLLQEIREAPPAATLELTAQGPRVTPYLTDRANRRFRPKELPAVIEGVADRTAALVQSLTEGPVGLALSGGRDSRLIGWMLRSRGIETRCYTTVDLGESDSSVEMVARALDAPVTMLRPWYETSPLDLGAVEVVCPTTMYGVANHTMSTFGQVPTGEVQIAGHLGDVPAGSHIDVRTLVAAARGGQQAASLAASLAMMKHLRLGPASLASIGGTDALEHVQRGVRDSTAGAPGVVQAERSFNLLQRQRRFILRDYLAARHCTETFLPLMDAEWLDFWAAAPPAALAGTALYERTLADSIFVGKWAGLAAVEANGRPLGARPRRHAPLALAEDFTKKVRRQVALRAGRGATVLTKRIAQPEGLDELAGLVDVDAVRTSWDSLGWDVQRSLHSVVLFRRQLATL